MKNKKNKIDSSLFDDKILESIVKEVLEILEPPPDISISEWARENRIIKYGGNPGPYNPDYAPYLKRILEAFLDPRVKKLVMMWSAQLGKSLTIENIIGYLMQYKPSPIMYVLPDDGMIKEFSDTKLKSLFEDTQSLAPLVYKSKTGSSGSRVDHISYKGGFVKLASAQSISSLAGSTMPYVLMDEVDKYPLDLKNQGGSVEQAERRAGAFEDYKILITSTPGYDGISTVQKHYLEGTQEKYYVPCPHCHDPFFMEMKLLKWDKEELNGTKKHLTHTAYLVCPSCGGIIHDHHKPYMLNNGFWKSENTNGNPEIVSTHINIFYSPWTPFSKIASEFIEKSKTEEGLKVFTNLFEGLPFKAKGDRPGWEVLLNRVEPYPMLTAPRGVCFCTAGVDFQDNRAAIAIYGWGRGEQSWLIYYGEIYGEYTGDKLWQEIDDLLNIPIQTVNGVSLSIIAAAFDSSDGDSTIPVYDYVRPRKSKNYIAIKGANTLTAPALGPGRKQEVDARGKLLKGSVELFAVGTHVIKSLLYARLKISIPGTKGYIHFYNSLDAHFFKMLTAEKLVTSYKDGYPKLKWENEYGRNEALDCSVYCYSAALYIGIQRANWDKLENKLYSQVSTVAKPDNINSNEETIDDPQPVVPQSKKKYLLKRNTNSLALK